MLSQDPQRIYLVGAGVIAQWHAGAADKLGRDTSIFVTDPNPSALAAFGARFPEASAATSVESLLATPARDEDIVVIAAPPFVHHDAAIAALNSGRHTLCEKPLAMNLSQAQTMHRRAKESGRFLGCCSCRFGGHPAASEVKRLIDSGDVGLPYHVRWIHRRRRARSGIEYQPESRWFLDPARSGGGVLMDWGPYDFAAMIDLFAPMEVRINSAFLAAPITQDEAKDTAVEQQFSASMTFICLQGVKLDVTYERAACTHGDECSIAEIECSRGAIRWDWLGGKSVSVTTDHLGQPKTVESPCTPQPLHPHERPLVYFDRRILGEASPAIVNDQALFNFACIRAIYDTAYTGQTQTVRLTP